MKKSTLAFILFCSVVLTLIVWVQGRFDTHFANNVVTEIQLKRSQENLARERFNNVLLTYQMKEFRERVAQYLPKNEQLANEVAKFELHNGVQLSRIPASLQKISVADSLEAGKKKFAEHDFDKAIKYFDKVISSGVAGEPLEQSYFLTAESYFLKRKYSESLEYIDQMVTMFPYSDLTGAILLRMGEIANETNQPENAQRIFEMVQTQFTQNADISEQARKLKEGVKRP